MTGYWRVCNHCGQDIQSAANWLAHCIAIAKGYGHRDDVWIKHIAAYERRMLGEEEYAHALVRAALYQTSHGV